MVSDWSETTLGALGSFRNGVNFNRAQEGAGIPVLKVKDFGGRSVVPVSGLDELIQTRVVISKENYLEAGDTVVMRSNGNPALVGRSMFFAGSSRPITFSGFCIRFRPDVSKVHARFASYLIRSPFFRERFSSHGSGTGITNLSQDLLASVPVSLPSLEEQEGIALILSALDAKIELLHRASENLERVALTIFKSWFVDFDPVRAKAEGREPEGMDALTASFFPDSFAEGGTPHDWVYQQANGLMEQSRQMVNPLKHPDQSFDHYSLPAFDDGRRPRVEMGRNIKSNKTMVAAGSLLVSKLNPHIPRIWLPDLRSGYISISSTEFLCFSPKQPFSSEYLFCQFSEVGFGNSMMGFTTGTSNSHQRINVEALMGVKLIRPLHRVVEAFTSVARPILNRAKANIAQQQTLAELRDTLLPRLISGKLRVPEAEKLVGAVL